MGVGTFDKQAARAEVLKQAAHFEAVWLAPYAAHAASSSPSQEQSQTKTPVPVFIGGRSHPSIADLTAYVEIAQVTQMSLLPDYRQFPLLQVWLDAMAGLPHHDEVHRSLEKLNQLGQMQVQKEEEKAEEKA